MIKKGILLFLFLISSLHSMGQGFVYSYDDPCTLKTKEIYIDNPNGNIALFYGGQTQTFTGTQIQSGAVQQWINQVNSSNPLGPCSGVGLSQNVTVNATIATNNIGVLTSVLSTLSSITSIGTSVTTSTVSSIGGSTIGGIVQADEKVTDNNNNSNENKNNSNKNTNGTTTNNNGGNSTTTNGNTGTSQGGGNQNNGSGVGGGTNSQGGTTTTTNNTTTGGEQTTQSPVSTPVASGSQTTNNQGNTSVPSNSPVTSGNNSTPNTNNSTTPSTNNSTESSGSGGGTLSGGANAVKADTNEKNEKQEQAKEEAKSVQSSAAQSSSGAKSKVAAVKQGSVMMTGDIVTISSAGGDPTQVKINASIIMSNTKNTFAKGALINFTSTVNNSNVTLFMSFRKKKLTTIFANSSMMNFEKDFFNTTSIMESYQYRKITGTVGINLTTGNIGDSKFQSISTLAGLIGTFKVNKNFGMTTMFVMVYSPYVFYYEGMWNQSGYIAVPFVAIDYKLTKKFKLNVSFSGVNQLNDKTLNYQVLLGAKAFL